MAPTTIVARSYSGMGGLRPAPHRPRAPRPTGKLGQANLNNMMLWHIMAKQLKHAEVPVLAILNEFRELSGIRGRNQHRGTNPPSYDFKVKMEAGQTRAPPLRASPPDFS